MKQKTKDGIRGLIAFVIIVAGMIFMIELGYFEFLRNPNDFRECQLVYGKTQCLESLDNKTNDFRECQLVYGKTQCSESLDTK